MSAIFAEAQFNDDLVTTIARETGVPVVSSLYTDTIGDAPLDTYEAVMRWNIDQVVAALVGRVVIDARYCRYRRRPRDHRPPKR